MITKQTSPNLEVSFPSIRWIVPLVFVATWFVLALLLNYLHWLSPFYGALLLTPILTTAILRIQIFQHHGIRFLPWRQASRLYGWSLITWVSLVTLFYSIELWRGKWAYASLLKEVEQSNRSLDVASLAPPIIDDAENLCATPLLASLIRGNENASLILGDFREISPSEELDRIRSVKLPSSEKRRTNPWYSRLSNPWYSNQTTDFDFWVRLFEQELDAPSSHEQASKTNTGSKGSPTEQILTYLKPHSSLINELLEACQNSPKSRWNLDFSRGWMVEGLAAERDQVLANLVSVLALRSSANLALNESKLAARDILLGMRLIDTVRLEPSIHTQLRRLGWLFVLFQPLWEGLADRKWAREHLDQFSTALGQIDLDAETERLRTSTALLEMDLWNEIDDAYSLRNLKTNYRELLQRDRGVLLWIGILWQFHPKGWSYQTQVLTYRWFFPPSGTETYLPKSTDPANTLFVIPKLQQHRADLETGLPNSRFTIEQARIACALEQAWIEHGRYPESLSALQIEPQQSNIENLIRLRSQISYHRTPNNRYLLTPIFVKNPSLNFKSENNPDLINLGNTVWDRVWRYPSPGTLSSE